MKNFTYWLCIGLVATMVAVAFTAMVGAVL